MSDLDPVQFGQLIGRVGALESQVSALQADVKSLLELANKSKGGFWLGMAIASTAGGVATWLASHAPWR